MTEMLNSTPEAELEPDEPAIEVDSTVAIERMAILGLQASIESGTPIRKPYRFAKSRLGITTPQTDFYARLNGHPKN